MNITAGVRNRKKKGTGTFAPELEKERLVMNQRYFFIVEQLLFVETDCGVFLKAKRAITCVTETALQRHIRMIYR